MLDKYLSFLGMFLNLSNFKIKIFTKKWDNLYSHGNKDSRPFTWKKEEKLVI